MIDGRLALTDWLLAGHVRLPVASVADFPRVLLQLFHLTLTVVIIQWVGCT